MTDQIEDLIREIAAKHGIAVARDDPILVLQTINQRLLADSAKAQQAQLDLYKEEMEALAHRWGNDAKEKAERVLNAALTASKETMNEMVQQGAESAAVAVQGALQSALGKLQVHSREIGRIAAFNIIAASLVLVASIAAAFASLG